MGRPLDKLAKCTGFQWDEGNAAKNWEKHDVSQSECEQIFFNRPLIARYDPKHSWGESRCFALGRTDANRLLFVAFTIRAVDSSDFGQGDDSEERSRYPL